MEELQNNKQFNILKWIFIIISILHVVYATITMRGMYMDGGFFMMQILDSISNSKINLVFDPGHPRFFMLWLLQLPVYIANSIFFISDKFALMMVYSFSHFALPLLALWWNYNLTKRTGRTDVLFWNFFTYCAIVITFCIFSVTESILGSMLQFVLLNYLVSNIKLKKMDYFAIFFLTAMMFAIYEYVIVLGVIFFIASLYYVKKVEDKKEKIAKLFIGIGSLFAGIYNFVAMLMVEDELSEIQRFLGEFHNYVSTIKEMNMSITVVSIIAMIILAFKKTKIGNKSILFFALVLSANLAYLLYIIQESLCPMMEGHYRTILCWFIPLVMFGIFLSDVLNKKINSIKLANCFCIILLCGIFQSAWQLVNSYYWNENIQYMKDELKKEENILYIPSEHDLISSYHTDTLRRYLWHGSYTYTSIIFSDEYEQKTLLLNYDEEVEESNHVYRDALFVFKEQENAMSIPFGATINIKNKYWDLTKCAQALDKYNKENNIQTWE